jgi:hypothetical protein
MKTSDTYSTFSGRAILRSGTPLVVLAIFEEDDGSCTGEVFVTLLGGALPFSFEHATRLIPANVPGAAPGVETLRKELLALANGALGDALAALHDKFGVLAYLAHEWELVPVPDMTLIHVWLTGTANGLFRALSKGKARSAALRARFESIVALPQLQPLPPLAPNGTAV